MTDLTGLVLAGGAGSRMGQDKATMRLTGQRLVDRAVQCLGECCVEVLVAHGATRPLDVAGARGVPDAPGEGPLAGIVGGLRHARTPLLAVIAVDMPRANSDVLRALATVWDGEAAVVPVVDGEPQPLHAVYAVSWTMRYARLLAAGERSARRALQTLGARTAAADAWGVADPTGRFALNLNTTEDLVAFEGSAEEDGQR